MGQGPRLFFQVADLIEIGALGDQRRMEDADMGLLEQRRGLHRVAHREFACHHAFADNLGEDDGQSQDIGLHHAPAFDDGILDHVVEPALLGEIVLVVAMDGENHLAEPIRRRLVLLSGDAAHLVGADIEQTPGDLLADCRLGREEAIDIGRAHAERPGNIRHCRLGITDTPEMLLRHDEDALAGFFRREAGFRGHGTRRLKNDE